MSSPELRDALFIASDQRSNFKQVIAKRNDLVERDGGRLKPAASGTVTWEAGTVLGKASSGADSGYFKAYDDTATDGSQTAVGVLEDTTVVDSSGNGSEISIIKSGCLFQDLLIGLDSAGITDLSGKVAVEHGVNLIRIRA